MDTTVDSAPDFGGEEASGSPTPRLTEPATEETEVSVERERDAVGDAPDTGGLTPPEQAQ